MPPGRGEIHDCRRVPLLPAALARRANGGHERDERRPTSRATTAHAHTRRGLTRRRAGSRRRLPTRYDRPWQRAARRVPVHPRRPRRRLPRAAVDDAPVRGLRVAPRRRTRASGCCSSAGRPASRRRSTCRRSSGLDSDDPLALGEVGRTGVAIDSLDDMRRLFDGIPLGEVSTSMTINAPAAVLLLLYELVGAEQGVAPARRCAARSRTTCSRSTRRAATTSSRRGPRCG